MVSSAALPPSSSSTSSWRGSSRCWLTSCAGVTSVGWGVLESGWSRAGRRRPVRRTVWRAGSHRSTMWCWSWGWRRLWLRAVPPPCTAPWRTGATWTPSTSASWPSAPSASGTWWAVRESSTSLRRPTAWGTAFSSWWGCVVSTHFSMSFPSSSSKLSTGSWESWCAVGATSPAPALDPAAGGCAAPACRTRNTNRGACLHTSGKNA